MSGFGGAGAFSDGKYNITNDFGGTLYEHIGKQPAIDLMEYVDEINMKYGGEGTKLYSTAGTKLKKVCMQNKLKLLDASVRHLGTDINYVVLENMYAHLKDKVDFYFDTPVESVEVLYDENTAGADACSLQEAHTDNVSGYAVKQRIAHMRADTVSSQLEEAEASGWRRSAMTLISQPSQTVWISVCVLSFRP